MAKNESQTDIDRIDAKHCILINITSFKPIKKQPDYLARLWKSSYRDGYLIRTACLVWT